MLAIIIVILCAIPALLIYFKQRMDKEDAELGLIGPPTKPLLGNFLEMSKSIKEDGDFYQCLSKWHKQYGDIFRVQFFNTRLVVISDPKLMELMANNQKVGKPFTYKFLKNWLGDSIIVANGPRWSKLRKLDTPSFHFQILEDFVKIFDEQSKVLVDILEKKNSETVDIPPYLARFAMDVICETAMGVKVGAQYEQPASTKYRQACLDLIHVIEKRSLNPLLNSDVIYKLSPMWQKEKSYLDIVHGFVNDVIEQKRNEIIYNLNNAKVVQDNDEGTKKRATLIEILLQSKMDGKPLSNQDISGEVNTFMFAGHDTTTSSTQMFLYLMAKNPIEQEKLYDEIKANVIDTGESITIRLINSLNYLDMCLKESLRFFPPLAGVGKVSEVPLECGKTKIKAGDMMMIMFRFNHFNPKYFPEPEKFKPERFNDAVSIEQRNPYAYTPFSFGLRNCIGQRFAVLEMKTVIINILAKFKVQLADPNYVPDLDYQGVLKIRNGVPLKFIKRE